MSWPSRLIFLRVVAALQCLAFQSSFDENLFWMGLVKLKFLKFSLFFDEWEQISR